VRHVLVIKLDTAKANDCARSGKLAFDANIGFHPAMVPADLEAAGPAIAAAARAYG